MHLTDRVRRYIAQIACFAVLWGVLSATIAHSLVGLGVLNTQGIELCSSSGMVLIKADTAQTSLETLLAAKAHFEKCPACQLASNHAALLPNQLPALPVAQVVKHGHSQAQHILLNRRVWVSGRPRAPPNSF